MSYPIETANVVLILVGIGLVISGPIIIYRTVRGVLNARRNDPKAKLHPISNGLNLVLAVLFSMAGVLFITNNLRGNPLSEKLFEKEKCEEKASATANGQCAP